MSVSNVTAEWVCVPMDKAAAKTVSALEQQLFSPPWSYQSVVEELDNPTAGCLVLRHRQSDEIGAYIIWHCVADELYIERIATASSYRRTGLSSELLKTSRDFALTNGVTRITLEVRVSNAAAIALYEKHGFVCDGVRPRFYDEPKEDAYIYSLYLPAKEETI